MGANTATGLALEAISCLLWARAWKGPSLPFHAPALRWLDPVAALHISALFLACSSKSQGRGGSKKCTGCMSGIPFAEWLLIGGGEGGD